MRSTAHAPPGPRSTSEAFRPPGRGGAAAVLIAVMLAPFAGIALLSSRAPDTTELFPEIEKLETSAPAASPRSIGEGAAAGEAIPILETPAEWAPRPFALPVAMATRVHRDVHLYVAPLGSVELRSVELVREVLAWVTGSESVTTLPRRPLPPTSWNPVRAMFDAQRVLDMLREIRPSDGYRLVGVTDGDLYAERLNYLFGLASPHRDVAIISTMRLEQAFWDLPEDRDVRRWRIFKLVAHELGHTFGIPHCTSVSCVMRPLRSISAVDSELPSYCDFCRSRVEGALRRAE